MSDKVYEVLLEHNNTLTKELGLEHIPIDGQIDKVFGYIIHRPTITCRMKSTLKYMNFVVSFSFTLSKSKK